MTSKRRYKKSFKTKRKKKVFTIKRAFYGFVLAGTFSGIAYFLFFSDVFEIKQIEISKVNKVSVKDIENAIWQKSNKNILLANFEFIEKDFLKKYPQIETMEIKRKLPNKLFVQIKERGEAAIFEDYYFIDKNGIVFERVKNFDSESLKIKNSIKNENIVLGRQYLEKEIMEKILKIKESFNAKEVEIVSEKRLNAKMPEDWQAYFSLKKDFDLQVEELKILLKEKFSPEERESLEYIDLRFDKIYFRKAS